MSVVELKLPPYSRRARIARRWKTAEQETKRRERFQHAAAVEAAVVHAAEKPEDPEFAAALKMVAASVKHLLSPRALAFLEATLDSDAKAGMVRWRELSRLQLWLSRARINKKKPVLNRGFDRQYENRRVYAAQHPFKMMEIRSQTVPGRTLAAIYGIAKRADVRPSTVIAALLNYGLERVTQAIRETKEVPPTLSREMLDAFPVVEKK